MWQNENKPKNRLNVLNTNQTSCSSWHYDRNLGMGINMRFRLYLKCHDFEKKMCPFVRFLKHKNKDTKNCKHMYQMLMHLILGKGTKDDCYILFWKKIALLRYNSHAKKYHPLKCIFSGFLYNNRVVPPSPLSTKFSSPQKGTPYS